MKIFKHPKIFALGCFTICVFLLYYLMPFQHEYGNEHYYLTQGDYLLYSPACKIINLSPWNVDAKKNYVKKDYYSCLQGQKMLSKLILDENQVDVFLELDYLMDEDLICCIKNVSRAKHSSTTYNDNLPKNGPCIQFDTSRIQVSNEQPTYIKCESNMMTVYENVHIPIALTEKVQHKLSTANPFPSRPLSVLILGIDSISRLNMMRTMPHTYKHLYNDPDWLHFKIFQKMDDNTFPNLLALLSGMNSSQVLETCNPYLLAELDACPIIWKQFSDRGYITAYSEDLANISTFNYKKLGFNQAPTDYYTRAYHLACAHYLKITIVDYSPFCSGLESDGERVWDITRDFVRLHKENPFFGFFWTNSFGHENVNTPGRIDDKIKDYLIDIIDAIDENTAVIFLSDHGIRFGPIRNTFTGYMEERLPFLFIRFPKWFQQEYSTFYNNIKGNTDKMVTPYDLYMTLQDILAVGDPSYQPQEALGCSKCHSLFDPINMNRSCQDANITKHWCTCSSLVPIYEHKFVDKAINVAMHKLNALIAALDEKKLCAKFAFHSVLNVFQSTNSYGGNANLIVIEFRTDPMATFEASINSGNMEMYGGFSRSDSYKLSSACINNTALKMFCYCKDYIGAN